MLYEERSTVYKICVAVPVTAVDPYFPLMLKKVTGVIRGAVCTKCVYTVPVTAVDPYFPLTLKKVTCVKRGTVYTKCVSFVHMKISLDVEESYWCYKRNGVYKMC